MNPQDLFVGVLAGCVGCCLILGALFDSAWLMTLAKSRALTAAVGKSAARWTLGGLGMVIVALGCLIALGWRMPWS
jgi:hypothetical protein